MAAYVYSPETQTVRRSRVPGSRAVNDFFGITESHVNRPLDRRITPENLLNYTSGETPIPILYGRPIVAPIIIAGTLRVFLDQRGASSNRAQRHRYAFAALYIVCIGSAVITSIFDNDHQIRTISPNLSSSSGGVAPNTGVFMSYHNSFDVPVSILGDYEVDGMAMTDDRLSNGSLARAAGVASPIVVSQYFLQGRTGYVSVPIIDGVTISGLLSATAAIPTFDGTDIQVSRPGFRFTGIDLLLEFEGISFAEGGPFNFAGPASSANSRISGGADPGITDVFIYMTGLNETNQMVETLNVSWVPVVPHSTTDSQLNMRTNRYNSTYPTIRNLRIIFNRAYTGVHSLRVGRLRQNVDDVNSRVRIVSAAVIDHRLTNTGAQRDAAAIGNQFGYVSAQRITYYSGSATTQAVGSLIMIQPNNLVVGYGAPFTENSVIQHNVTLGASRMINTYNAMGEASNTLVENNNPVWALIDIWLNILNESPTALDFPSLVSTATATSTQIFENATGRLLDAALPGGLSTQGGFSFDLPFGERTPVIESLTSVANSLLASLVIKNGRVGLVRDTLSTGDHFVFGSHNVIPTTFSVNYVVSSSNLANTANITYYDRMVRRTVTVCHTIRPSGEEPRWANMSLPGVASEGQARHIVGQILRASRYRRKLISFNVGLEGLIVNVGDTVRVANQLINEEIDGEVINYEEMEDGTIILTIDQQLSFDEDVHVIVTDNNGRSTEPVAVTRIRREQLTLANRPLAVNVDSEGAISLGVIGQERPTFIIGPLTQITSRYKITEINASAEDVSTIVAYEDAPEVYS